jgi:hypothetical protein
VIVTRLKSLSIHFSFFALVRQSFSYKTEIETMQFDEFYETIGVFGPYQKVKYLLLCFTNLLPPVMVYAWTFIAATPSFHCKTPLDDFSASNLTNELLHSYIPSAAQCLNSQKSISLRECQRCFHSVNISNNDSAIGDLSACRSFVFDRTYYQSTLVEDVSYFSI